MKPNLRTWENPPPSIQVLVIALLLFVVACKKSATEPDLQLELRTGTLQPSAMASSSTCYETLEPDWYDDTVRTHTVLGRRLTGSPYSLSTMQQAAMNLYGNSNGITVNKKYVRFKPADYDQLQQLTQLDLELFDYPLDYEVVQEGEYYNQGLPPNEIPWYYTVVEPQFTPPAGIAYEVLASLHVPDSDLNLENEAFRITGNPTEPLECSNISVSSVKKGDKDSAVINRVPQCPVGYHWDNVERICVPDNCPPGYYWSNVDQQCVPDIPAPPTPSASKKPSGQIQVRDNALNSGNGVDVAVRRARVVMKRFLKIDRVYTDDQGNFSSGKYFHNKVNIIVKFKNNDLTIRPLVAVGFHQMLFEMKQGIGKYSGNLSGIRHVFIESTDRRSRIYRNWWAAQMMNAYQESNAMATSMGIGALPSNLNIMLTKSGLASASGSATMNFHRINAGTTPREWIEFFLQHPLNTYATSWVHFIQTTLMRTVDITLGYYTVNPWRSDRVKALMYHELAHARHFSKVGAAWWNSFVYAETSTIVRWRGSQFEPYGDGSDGTASEYISVAESWAEHVARVMCDQQYGGNSTRVLGFSRDYLNNDPINGLTSHLNYLEDYDPDDVNNPFRWIPEGIYNDLIDARNEFPTPISDGVSGFTNAQIFSALDADVSSMPQFRERLILENPASQTAQARSLFTQYHY